jgi:hypothetical protein
MSSTTARTMTMSASVDTGRLASFHSLDEVKDRATILNELNGNQKRDLRHLMPFADDAVAAAAAAAAVVAIHPWRQFGRISQKNLEVSDEKFRVAP